jgi:hypothetical protein
MADTPASDGEAGLGAYELQVYAMSPVAPSPQRLLAEAEGGGWPVEIREQDGSGPDDEGWSRLVLGTSDAGPGIIVTVHDGLQEQLAAFREAAGEGEEIPEGLFEANRLFLVELPDAPGEGDDQDEEGDGSEAAFVLSAWALAALTDGLIFDPQEEFFADAESFLALLMDEDGAEAGMAGQAGD